MDDAVEIIDHSKCGVCGREIAPGEFTTVFHTFNHPAAHAKCGQHVKAAVQWFCRSPKVFHLPTDHEQSHILHKHLVSLIQKVIRPQPLSNVPPQELLKLYQNHYNEALQQL